MITVTHIKLSCITSQKQPNNFFNPYLCLYNLPSGNLLCGIGYGCSYTPPIQVCLIIFYSLWACTGIEWEWRKKPFIPYVLLLSKTKKCLWFWNFLFMLLLQCKTCMHEHIYLYTFPEYVYFKTQICLGFNWLVPGQERVGERPRYRRVRFRRSLLHPDDEHADQQIQSAPDLLGQQRGGGGGGGQTVCFRRGANEGKNKLELT